MLGLKESQKVEEDEGKWMERGGESAYLEHALVGGLMVDAVVIEAEVVNLVEPLHRLDHSSCRLEGCVSLQQGFST